MRTSSIPIVPVSLLMLCVTLSLEAKTGDPRQHSTSADGNLAELTADTSAIAGKRLVYLSPVFLVTESRNISPLLEWAIEMARIAKEERERNGGDLHSGPIPNADDADAQYTIGRD